MKNKFKYMSTLFVCLNFIPMIATAGEKHSFSTDSLYHEIIRTVDEVDFKAMAAAYHPDAVLVTGKTTMPIGVVMKRWTEEGEKFQKEGGTASVLFRFSDRKVNESTAFETGIFLYSTTDKDGTVKASYSHFQDLNVKKDGQWLTIMEHQLNSATEAEWNALPEWK